jgi:hypothetical protein
VVPFERNTLDQLCGSGQLCPATAPGSNSHGTGELRTAE